MGERRGRMGRKPRNYSGKSFKDRQKSGFRRDSGDSRRFNNRSSGRRDGRRPLEMHKIICDKCGKESEVPFKPTSSKPIYCSDCFRKREGSSSGSSGELERINQKLDKIMQALKIR